MSEASPVLSECLQSCADLALPDDVMEPEGGLFTAILPEEPAWRAAPFAASALSAYSSWWASCHAKSVFAEGAVGCHDHPAICLQHP